MIGRRTLVGSGLAAGIAAVATGAPSDAQARDMDAQSRDGLRDVERAIERLRGTIEKAQDGCDLGPCPAVRRIREAQHTFLRSNRKYPDFIDVGIELWDTVHDWHVKNRQPLNVVRMQDGSYGMAFMFTTLVLRPEHPGGYMSFGYDTRG